MLERVEREESRGDHGNDEDEFTKVPNGAAGAESVPSEKESVCHAGAIDLITVRASAERGTETNSTRKSQQKARGNPLILQNAARVPLALTSAVRPFPCFCKCSRDIPCAIGSNHSFCSICRLNKACLSGNGNGKGRISHPSHPARLPATAAADINRKMRKRNGGRQGGEQSEVVEARRRVRYWKCDMLFETTRKRKNMSSCNFATADGGRSQLERHCSCGACGDKGGDRTASRQQQHIDPRCGRIDERLLQLVGW